MAAMRKSADWMSAPDDRILEIAADDEDGIVKVGNAAKHRHVHVQQPQVSRRCKKLAENGLLRAIGDGVYVITDEGRGYLNEEYDVEAGMWVDDEEEAEGPTAETDPSEANGV